MATDDDSDVPETGAVFTFGKSKFGDNTPSKFWIRNDRVIQVACGDEHTALVAESGRIFTFGANDWGQLGLGNNKIQTKPNCIKALKKEKIIRVACGRSHTLVATESGKIFSFGANGESQLGRGDVDDTSAPGVIDALKTTQYSVLAGGTDHSAVLTETGRVFVWGGGSEGQLGLGDVTECPTPTQLKLDEEVVALSCGYYHTALVTASGKLYTFGESEGGKLGTEADVDHTVPVYVSTIPESVVSVACGGSHTAAVTKCGKVYTFGDGSNGQLGHGNIILQSSTPQAVTGLRNVKIKYVSCGENHTAVISEKGQLYCFGDGRHGKLGLGEENFANQFKPSLVTRFAKFVVDKVSCGGCHMLSLACPKNEEENGDFMSSEEDEELDISPHKNMLSTVKREEDLELSGTFSARDRRRQNSPLPSLNRTLPPLNSSLVKRSLPPLSATVGPSSDKAGNPLNRGTLPQIHISEADAQKLEDDSDVSVTPEGESDSEEDIDETRKKMKASSAAVSQNKGVPVPKPRPKPAPRQQQQSQLQDESESDEGISEDEEEEDARSRRKKPAKKAKLTRFGRKKEEKNEDDETKGKKEKDDKKKKKSEEDEEEEEEEEKNDKKKKKTKDLKKTKKKAGIFGRSKFVDSEEDEDDDVDEEDSEVSKASDEKVKKDKDSKTKDSKDKKDKDKKEKDKDKEEKDKDKKGKEKDKKEKEKKDKEKDSPKKDKKTKGKKGKDAEEDEEEEESEKAADDKHKDKNGAKENASEEITPADDSKKDSDKNDKKAQSTPEKKKKSSLCVIL